MLALYRLGRQADALRAYEETRHSLQAELGVEPGQALRALHSASSRQIPSLDGPRPAAGERDARPTNSRAVSSFVGRRRELDSVLSLMDRNRLVTLTGPGGTARPGWHWSGRRIAGRNRCGVASSTCDRPVTPTCVCGTIADGLDLRLDGEPEPVDALACTCRTGRRSSSWTTSSTSSVAPSMSPSSWRPPPGCGCSRRHANPSPSMVRSFSRSSPCRCRPHGTADVQQLRDSEAVRLFLDRAGAASASRSRTKTCLWSAGSADALTACRSRWSWPHRGRGPSACAPCWSASTTRSGCSPWVTRDRPGAASDVAGGDRLELRRPPRPGACAPRRHVGFPLGRPARRCRGRGGRRTGRAPSLSKLVDKNLVARETMDQWRFSPAGDHPRVRRRSARRQTRRPAAARDRHAAFFRRVFEVAASDWNSDDFPDHLPSEAQERVRAAFAHLAAVGERSPACTCPRRIPAVGLSRPPPARRSREPSLCAGSLGRLGVVHVARRRRRPGGTHRVGPRRPRVAGAMAEQGIQLARRAGDRCLEAAALNVSGSCSNGRVPRRVGAARASDRRRSVGRDADARWAWPARSRCR